MHLDNNLTMEHEQIEGIDVIVLERTGELRTGVNPAELPHHLSNPRSLVWCDITGTEGGQRGPYGQLLREVFGFDELTIEDSFTKNHLRSEEHTSELQSRQYLVCRLLLEKKKQTKQYQ